MPDTSLLVIFPTWPSTHHGHFVRSRKYRTTYMWLRPRTNFRVWPGSRLDKMAPRNPCWRRYIHRSTWSGRSAVSIPAAGRALACTWTRKIVRACERVCVCGGGHVHSRTRGEGEMWYTWDISRDTLLYLALVRHVCRWHRWKREGRGGRVVGIG